MYLVYFCCILFFSFWGARARESWAGNSNSWTEKPWKLSLRHYIDFNLKI